MEAVAVPMESQRLRVPRSLRRPSALAWALVAAVLASAALRGRYAAPPTSYVAPPLKQRYSVVLQKDHEQLGKRGDVVKVKKGYYRNILFPLGIARKQDFSIEIEMRKQLDFAKTEIKQMNFEAMQQKQAIEKAGIFIFEKKVRVGTNKIYGSLTATNVAETIAMKTAVPVRIHSISVPKAIELGEYAGTVEITESVTAYFTVKIVAEGSAVEGKEDEK